MQKIIWSQYSEDVTSYYSAPSDLSNIRLDLSKNRSKENDEKSIEECKIVFINIKRFNQLTGMTSEDEILCYLMKVKKLILSLLQVDYTQIQLVHLIEKVK